LIQLDTTFSRPFLLLLHLGIGSGRRNVARSMTAISAAVAVAL
jgi:hypothetical protein